MHIKDSALCETAARDDKNDESVIGLLNTALLNTSYRILFISISS